MKLPCHDRASQPSRGTRVSTLVLTPHGPTASVCSENHKDTENQVRLLQVQHDAHQSTPSCITITPQSEKTHAWLAQHPPCYFKVTMLSVSS